MTQTNRHLRVVTSKQGASGACSEAASPADPRLFRETNTDSPRPPFQRLPVNGARGPGRGPGPAVCRGHRVSRTGAGALPLAPGFGSRSHAFARPCCHERRGFRSLFPRFRRKSSFRWAPRAAESFCLSPEASHPAAGRADATSPPGLAARPPHGRTRGPGCSCARGCHETDTCLRGQGASLEPAPPPRAVESEAPGALLRAVPLPGSQLPA